MTSVVSKSGNGYSVVAN